MEVKTWGLSWEMKHDSVESNGAGAKIVEMISTSGFDEGLDWRFPLTVLRVFRRFGIDITEILKN